MRALTICTLLVLGSVACQPETPRRSPSTNAADATLADSAQARTAVVQYLDALADRGYQRAARRSLLATGAPAAHFLATVPDTLTSAGFLQSACDVGYYVCRLHLARVTSVTFARPDTIVLSVVHTDSLRRPYSWGPCCGDDGPPSTVDRVTTVARESGYAVVNLPLYIP